MNPKSLIPLIIEAAEKSKRQDGANTDDMSAEWGNFKHVLDADLFIQNLKEAMEKE